MSFKVVCEGPFSSLLHTKDVIKILTMVLH